MRQAACVGKAPNRRLNPEAKDPWFPEKGESTTPGKIICFTCPVRAECKEYRDRTHSKNGMWGGEIKKRGSA
jgi:hypothetical protein